MSPLVMRLTAQWWRTEVPSNGTVAVTVEHGGHGNMCDMRYDGSPFHGDHDTPASTSYALPTWASATVLAEAWPAMAIATARSFLGLVSCGMPANLCCDGGGRRHDTIMILPSARLQTRTVPRDLDGLARFKLQSCRADERAPDRCSR